MPLFISGGNSYYFLLLLPFSFLFQQVIALLLAWRNGPKSSVLRVGSTLLCLTVLLLIPCFKNRLTPCHCGAALRTSHLVAGLPANMRNLVSTFRTDTLSVRPCGKWATHSSTAASTLGRSCSITLWHFYHPLYIFFPP